MDGDRNEGLIRFSSLSCYKEMSRLAMKDRPPSRIFRPRPLFIREVYDMVDDPSTDSVVSWSESGKSFIVWKESEFLGDVLPSCLPFAYFKDMTSFTKWLCVLRFSKVEESEHWEYTGDFLERGEVPPETDTSPCTPFMITREHGRRIERMFAFTSAPKQ